MARLGNSFVFETKNKIMKQFNDEWSDNLSEFKILSFEEVSAGFEGNKNLLQGVQKPNPENTEYKDDEYINLTNLLDRIKLSYRNGNEMQYVFSEYFNDTPQMYIMDDGKNHIDISAKIALKNGSIKVSQNLGNDKPFMEVFFDNQKRLTYTLSFCFSESRQVAIVLSTHSFEEYRNLLLYLGYGDVETDYNASKFFIKEFTDFLKDTKNTADDLYKVYADLPKSFIVHIHLATEKVVEHLKILTKEDDTGWFSWGKDTSSLLITVMAMFRDYNKVVDYFNENPKFVNEIYDNLDGHSEILGQPISNRILFASTLNIFTQQDQDAKTKITNVLTSYGNYYIESNILELNDTLNTIKGIVSFDWDFDYKDAIFLQQKRTVTKVIEQQETDEFGKGGTTREETKTVNEDIDPGYFYNPMSPVTYFDKEENPHLVTALFIKAIADEKEWAEVMHHIHIGGDIFAIILGVMTLGTTSGFSVVAIADLTLAGVDLILMNEDVQKWLSQYPEGKWFVENWDLIYAFVGAGIMSVVIMEGIFTHGTALLERLKNVKNIRENYLTFTKQLEKLITELDAYKVRTATNIIDEVVITAEKNGLWRKILNLTSSSEKYIETVVRELQFKGISLKKVAEESYEIFYKSEKLIINSNQSLGKLLQKLYFVSSKNFEKVLYSYFISVEEGLVFIDDIAKELAKNGVSSSARNLRYLQNNEVLVIKLGESTEVNYKVLYKGEEIASEISQSPKEALKNLMNKTRDIWSNRGEILADQMKKLLLLIKKSKTMVNTSAKIGEESSEQTIKWGTVKMQLHPKFGEMMKFLQERNVKIVEIKNVVEDVAYQEIHVFDLKNNLVRVEKTIMWHPEMRFLDLEHEIDHIIQFEKNLKGKYSTYTKLLKREGVEVDRELSHLGFTTKIQKNFLEYEVRIREVYRLKERGVAKAIIEEHLEGLKNAANDFELPRHPKDRLKFETWRNEHFPDYEPFNFKNFNY